MNTNPHHRMLCCRVLAIILLVAANVLGGEVDELERAFAEPPQSARIKAYWWWLNGNVDRAAITRDLEAMAAKGFGGALICDAGGASQDGNDPVPHGPTFMTPEWRELYRHALREAARLDLEMSLNIQSGWNLGGPVVPAEDAPKRIVWSDWTISGPVKLERRLPEPQHPPDYYRDLFVLAYPRKNDGTARPMLTSWEQKALHRRMGFSAPDTSHLLIEAPEVEGEEGLHAQDVIHLTEKMDADGVLRWDVPAGDWEIIRIGCTLNDHCHVSTCSDGWKGYALDPFDAGALRRYWAAVVDPLIADAGPLAGRTLKFLHTDSWEVEVANWTPAMREEFRKRRGYDPLAYLPVLAGRIVNSRSVSNRFLHDWRKTMGDLAIDKHYAIFRELAHKHDLLIHPESGGPHTVPIDSLRCLGMNDAPMSEFWARSWRHRVGDENRFFVKQPASAAHTYGHRLVMAEGFTTIGPHWQETLWDNLKPSFDRALCEGLNMLVWHAFTCSPESMGLPGQEYFAGTHFNPNATWWDKSGPFLKYLNRCQHMLQQGLFVADAVYYYGDHVPNFTQLRRSDPARVLPGHDYDVATEEVVVTHMRVEDGDIVLPDGMRYRLLVLRDHRAISLPVLRKVTSLVSEGATVIGSKPESAMSLQDYPACDDEVTRLADALWGDCDGVTVTEHRFGRGRLIWGRTAREVLLADGVVPDFAFTLTGDSAVIETKPDEPTLEYIHRRDEGKDIYFISNRAECVVTADVRFRVDDKPPELWDPLTGKVRALPQFAQADDRTTVPLEFMPYGSWFVLFREGETAEPEPTGRNFAAFATVGELNGAWTVHFDPEWGGPESVEFPELVSWTTRPEDGIRFYSGTATYEKAFDLPDSLDIDGDQRLWLDLGKVRELTEVRLNGQELGILWTMPFRADITGAVRPKDNRLEIEVVNFWPNRIIGDASLPPEKRRTNTNIRKLTAETPLVESGLLGPVTLQAAN